jgi:hypothetical protein
LISRCSSFVRFKFLKAVAFTKIDLAKTVTAFIIDKEYIFMI